MKARLLALMMLAAVACSGSGDDVNPVDVRANTWSVLDDGLNPLVADFNHRRDALKLVFIVGPT